jgi:hypothetical protein
MDPAIPYHFGSHPPLPQAAMAPMHPYQQGMTPYSTIPNECMYYDESMGIYIYIYII